ncbi:hypothetical protein [Streptosporangium sp. NPDC048865]|uniref:hypothetical protein n=1 Tax=Streptosporangium sp. NPDC048865 TaxID=3155766 RepID=UPI00342D483D
MTGPGWSPDARVVREGPLTWAQHEWVQWIPTDTDTSYEDNICAAVPGRNLPTGQVAAAVRDVLARHEGLRSLVRRAGREDSRQYVCPVDDRLDEVIQVMEDEASFRRRFDTPWRRTCFRIGEQWPVRAVLDTTGGHVRRIDLVVDHVAIDPWGMRVLCDDLNRALRARAAGREPFGSGPAVEQPIDVALSETSPAGLTYQRRALAYWERRLGEIGKALDGHVPYAPSRAPLGGPGGSQQGGPQPAGSQLDGPQHSGAQLGGSEQGEFRSCWLASRRAGRAAGVIARATGVSPSAAFLLAFGAAVCAVERSSRAGIFAISANRFSAGAGRSVRKATMTMPVLLPAVSALPAASAVSAESPGDAYRRALADCAAQQLSGHRFANADPYATERMCEEILGGLYKTGVAYPRFSYMDEGVADDLNTLWPAGDDGFPGDEDDRTVTFSPPRPLGARYMMTVLHRPAGAVFSLQWSDATGWGETAEDMLLYVEDLMVWAASEYAGDPPVLGGTGPAA